MGPRYALIALLPLLAVGCGRSPSTTFLALEPAPPATTTATYRGPVVRVPFLRVPVTLDRPEFVRQVAGTVIVSDFDRWAAPLGLLARNTLIQDLQARLPAGKVLPPDAALAMPEVRVEATVLAFHVDGGEAMMDVSYRLVNSGPGDEASVSASPRPATLRTTIANETPIAQARAWSIMLGQLADRVALQIADRR